VGEPQGIRGRCGRVRAALLVALRRSARTTRRFHS